MSAHPFAYKGGGYWRDDSAPRGERAFIIHGDEAIELGRWTLVADCAEELERERQDLRRRLLDTERAGEDIRRKNERLLELAQERAETIERLEDEIAGRVR